MSNTIQPSYGAQTYSVPSKAYGTKWTGTQGGSFFDLATRARRRMADILEINRRTEVTKDTETSNMDAYMEHLKKKYGRVTIESVGKDQASLEKAGKRMSGNDVVIAPNILEDMANDPKKAIYYEQKIDYFFNTVIPKGNAICAAQGLVFEPGGVVVHEDGTVTYICGCSDSPERVAEVNRINREKARKKAEQQRQYQEQTAAVAVQRRTLTEMQHKKQILLKTLYGRTTFDAGTNFYIAYQSQAIDSTGIAYQSAMGQTASIPAETVLAMTQAQVLGSGEIL